MINFWKRLRNPEIKFKAVYGDWSISTPVMAAKDFKSKWMKEQPKETSIVNCPGIHDFLTSGYIISLPVDYKILSNSAGTAIIPQSHPIDPLPRHMVPTSEDKLNPEMIRGFIANKVDKVKVEVCKISLPWHIQTPKGYSVIALPCMYQADYLDNIHIYGGIVDTDVYFNMSLIFSVKKPGEYTLPAGTPVLHIIPFKREEFNATCGKASIEEMDLYKYSGTTRIRHWYRKYFQSKKKFNMECENEHIFFRKK